MYWPVALFFRYDSHLPWWCGTLFLVLGLFLLWATRHTAKYYPVYGKKYYAFSAIVRPLGILLIAWSWVEIFSVQTLPGLFYIVPFSIEKLILFSSPVVVLLLLIIFLFRKDKVLFGILMGWAILTVLHWKMIPYDIEMSQVVFSASLTAAFIFTFLYSICSIMTLGLRRSFFYAKIGDPLISRGPYEYHRHPQLLCALLLSFISIFLIRPINIILNAAYLFRLLNFAIMTVGVILTIRTEERDLQSRLGTVFTNYQSQVPYFSGNRSKAATSWGQLVVTCIIVFPFWIIYFFISMAIFDFSPRLMPMHESKFLFYRGMNPSLAGFSFRVETGSVVGSISRYYFDNKVFPEDFKTEWIEEWRKNSRPISDYPYPQTLFYCNHIYYSQTDEDLAKQHFKVVRELPFPLRCSPEVVEAAFAMDYDGDGFPKVAVAVFDLAEHHGYYEISIATDDETNTILGEWKERAEKQKGQ